MKGLRDFVKTEVQKFRLGFYRAVAAGTRDNRQVSVQPDWCPDAVEAKTIQSPILDIRPKTGTPLAVISQDGVAAFAGVLGQLFESGAAAAMQAWLRADLEADPDKVWLGADSETRLGTSAAPSGVMTEDSLADATEADLIELVAQATSLSAAPGPLAGAALKPFLDALVAYLNAQRSAAAFSSTVVASK